MLRDESRVEELIYVKQLGLFKEIYGSVKPWHIRISLHLATTKNQRDRRQFAYVYMIWQDQTHGFHMFRERWVKQGDYWYTRVVGLLPNKPEIVQQ